MTKVGSGEAAKPVAGLEATLRAELRGGGERLPLPLAPQADPGGSGAEAETRLYEAPFLLTTPGTYRVRLIGEIEGVPIDEALFSHPVAPGWLDPLAAPQFPEAGRRERQREATRPVAGNDRAAHGQDLAQVGIVVGSLVVLVGLLALWRLSTPHMRNAARTGQHRSERPPEPADRE